MNILIDYFNHTWGYVELAGTIASLICVYLAVKQNIWTWFWGAIGVACFGPLFFHYKLYSDAGLQILFFLPIQAIGYYWWKTKGPDRNVNLPVTRLSNQTNMLGIMWIIIVSAITGYYMDTYTDASFPYADALTTWMSIFAQILMVKKVFESWILWVTMDAVAIVIYAAKGLVVVSGLYMLFFVLASYGGYMWYKSLVGNTENAKCPA